MKEEHEELTVTDIFEQIKHEICDDFCKYPTLAVMMILWAIVMGVIGE